MIEVLNNCKSLDPGRCEKCPYKTVKDGCVTKMLEDTIAVLKQKEEDIKVLNQQKQTLYEMLDSLEEELEGYERKERELVSCTFEALDLKDIKIAPLASSTLTSSGHAHAEGYITTAGGWEIHPEGTTTASSWSF